MVRLLECLCECARSRVPVPSHRSECCFAEGSNIQSLSRTGTKHSAFSSRCCACLCLQEPAEVEEEQEQEQEQQPPHPSASQRALLRLPASQPQWRLQVWLAWPWWVACAHALGWKANYGCGLVSVRAHGQ
jgi:hypothetical protein